MAPTLWINVYPVQSLAPSEKAEPQVVMVENKSAVRVLAHSPEPSCLGWKYVTDVVTLMGLLAISGCSLQQKRCDTKLEILA